MGAASKPVTYRDPHFNWLEWTYFNGELHARIYFENGVGSWSVVDLTIFSPTFEREVLWSLLRNQ